MFQFMRKRVGSEKRRRSGVSRPVLEDLERRDVPTALSSLPSLAVDTGFAQGVLEADVAIAAPAAAQQNTNGAAGQMPAFYDGEQFIVNMKEMPEDASAATIAHNGSINTIFATNDLDEKQDFKPVIDAIHGDGFNPLWRQVLIVFNQGFAPHQFTSDEQVKAAASGPNPEITLVVTDEVYRCSVVGAGHKA
jgi:hypothetical protein